MIGIDYEKSDESPWYQPQQGGLEAFLDHFGDQFFDHEGDDSAWYQPQQGGLEAFLDHFGDQIFDHEGAESPWYQPKLGWISNNFGSVLGSGF